MARHRVLEEAPSRTCATGICDPKRTQGLKAPASKGRHTLVSLKGPGVFVAAQVTKQGGNTGLTFVNLEIDGRNVTSLSFVAADNMGLTQQNPYGIVLLRGKLIETFTVGFPSLLRFEKDLMLSVTVNEPGVVQLIGNVIHGQA